MPETSDPAECKAYAGPRDAARMGQSLASPFGTMSGNAASHTTTCDRHRTVSGIP
jgi:hypothetical protein